MGMKTMNGAFENASQRVAYTYLRLLSDFQPVLPEGMDEKRQAEMRLSQADLHAFFETLYDAMFSLPGEFGLPQAADIYILADHLKEGPGKTDVKRVLDKQRKLVEEGLSFLSALGREGWLEEDTLILDAAHPVLNYLKKKSGRAFAKGLGQAGLELSAEGGKTIANNLTFPRMMPALKLLAESCAKSENPDVGRIFFARCDFRAIAGDFNIDARDLFRIFDPELAAWAADLHTYFTARKYKAQVEFGRMFDWVVKYQGKKTIKASPLFQVGFDERLLNQMRAGIKCASAQRVVPLLPAQSQALQEDFARRSFTCGNCHWCDNHKSLGPVDYEYRGEKRSICWYVNSDVYEFTTASSDLVKEYAVLHEGMEN